MQPADDGELIATILIIGASLWLTLIDVLIWVGHRSDPTNGDLGGAWLVALPALPIALVGGVVTLSHYKRLPYRVRTTRLIAVLVSLFSLFLLGA